MSHHSILENAALKAAFTQNGGTGGAFPEGDGEITMAQFQDQTNPQSYAPHDGLVPTCYTETNDHWWVIISKCGPVGATYSGQLMFIGETGTDFKPSYRWSINANTGVLRVIIQGFSAVLRSYTGTVNAGDGNWHVCQLLDEVAGAGPYTGTVRLKVDDNARESATAYTRPTPDATYPKWFTLGHARQGPLPSLATPDSEDFDSVYFAQITGCAPSDVQMDSVYNAWDTGGGKQNLQFVTDAITAVVTAAGGTLEWAGPLDGVTGSAHVDTIGAGDPDYTNVLFTEVLV